jgi:hypothetical protein
LISFALKDSRLIRYFRRLKVMVFAFRIVMVSTR